MSKYLDLMPDFLCKDGKHYHLFIAKGTRNPGEWVIGYSNYEEELLPPVANKCLMTAVCQLTTNYLKMFYGMKNTKGIGNA